MGSFGFLLLVYTALMIMIDGNLEGPPHPGILSAV
jgi:hypothetical protein